MAMVARATSSRSSSTSAALRAVGNQPSYPAGRDYVAPPIPIQNMPDKRTALAPKHEGRNSMTHDDGTPRSCFRSLASAGRWIKAGWPPAVYGRDGSYAFVSFSLRETGWHGQR